MNVTSCPISKERRLFPSRFWPHGKSLLLGLICCGFLHQSHAQGVAELVSLSEIVADFKRSGDLTRATYFLKRCSGLSMTIYGLLENAGPASRKASEEWLAHGASALEMTVKIEQEIEKQRRVARKTPESKLWDQSLEAAKQLAGIYSDRMNKNLLLTGNRFSGDRLIEGDMVLCQSPNKSLTQ